jgi:hypothetical protein
MNISQIDVTYIHPDLKDRRRAENLVNARCNGQNRAVSVTAAAQKMANLIRDPYKLVRRAKAIIIAWGMESKERIMFDEYFVSGNAWLPFKERLIEMGFTVEQISTIELAH